MFFRTVTIFTAAIGAATAISADQRTTPTQGHAIMKARASGGPSPKDGPKPCWNGSLISSDEASDLTDCKAKCGEEKLGQGPVTCVEAQNGHELAYICCLNTDITDLNGATTSD